MIACHKVQFICENKEQGFEEKQNCNKMKEIHEMKKWKWQKLQSTHKTPYNTIHSNTVLDITV